MLAGMIKKVRIPAALGILLWPSLAMADPASAVMLLGSFLVKVGVTYIGYALIAGTVIYGTIDARRRARHAADDARRARNAQLEDRSQNVLSAVPPWIIRYGRTTAGCSVHAIFTTDKTATRENGQTYTKKDAYKHVVYVHAAHECEAIHECYVNGIAVGQLTGDGWSLNPKFRIPKSYTSVRTLTLAPGASQVYPEPITVIRAHLQLAPTDQWIYVGNIIGAPYTLTNGGKTITNPDATRNLVVELAYANSVSSLRISHHLGDPNQTVDTFLNGLLPDKWTANHRLRGRCYSVVTFDLENTEFQGGVPKFEADLSGKKLYDPRDATTVYKPNGALVIRDFLRNKWGADADDLEINDTDYTVPAANDCDVGIPVPVKGYTDSTLWQFFTTGNTDGWTAVNATLTVASPGGIAKITSTLLDPQFISPVVSIVGSANRFVRCRVRRLGGASWEGALFYQTAGHGFNIAYFAYAAAGLAPGGDWVELVFDMHSLKAGGTDWKTSTITRLRLDFGGNNANSDEFEIDWVAVSSESQSIQTQPKYEIHGVFSTDESREGALNGMAEAIAGMVHNSGQWLITAGAWSTPVDTINDADLMGQIQIVQADAGLEELINGVRGTYFAASTSGSKEFKPYINSTFVTEDGEELWDDTGYSWTNDEQRCQNLARIRVERIRSGQIIQIPANLSKFPLRIGDRIYVNNTEFGFSNKTYLITDWDFGLTSPVMLTAQEDSAVIWDLADAVVYDQTPNTTLQDPRVVLPFQASDITIQSGTNHLYQNGDGSFQTRVYLSWVAPPDPYLADENSRTLIRWRRVARDEPGVWRELSVPMSTANTYLLGAVSSDEVIVGLAAANSLGFTSEFIYMPVHTVIGEAAAPSDVTGLAAVPAPGFINLSWTQCPDIDYADTELRVGVSFAAGTRIFKGNASAYQYPQANPLSVTIWAKHFDRSGNQSAANVSVTSSSLGAAVQNNWDFSNGTNDGWVNIGAIGTDANASGGKYGTFSGVLGATAYGRGLPIDVNRTYRVSARIFVVGGSGGPVYVGAIPFDSAGAVLTNSGGGTLPYCAAAGFSVPSGQWLTFSGVMHGSIAYPTADPTYLNKFPVGCVTASGFVMPYTGFTGTLLIDYAIIEDITESLAAADGLAFNAWRVWDFNSQSTDGWTASGATISAVSSPGELVITSSGGDPILASPALSFFGGNFDRVRVKVRRAAGTAWDGALYYSTPGHGYSASYRQVIPADQQPGAYSMVIEWDMSKLTTANGGTDWLGNQITGIRIDLGNGASDVFAIDWIAIGKLAPAADFSNVSNAQWVGVGVTVVGDTAVKGAGVSAWDASVYSKESYRGGCFASASYDVEADGAVFFGINSDPLADNNFTSLDYAWYFDAAGLAYVVIAGSITTAYGGAPATADVYSVVYDGSRVNFLKNGVLMAAASAGPDLVFFFDSSFANPLKSKLNGMRFGPLSSNYWGSIGGGAKPADYASADLYLVNSGNCTQSGNRVTKTGGTSTWDAGMHSRDGYRGAAACSIVVHNSETTAGYQKMFGLNNVPSSTSYADINFGMLMNGVNGTSGDLFAYLEGSVANGGASIGTFADNDTLGVTYDGYTARWYKNGVVLFTYTTLDTTSSWYFDCGIVQVGEFLDRISFRPMSQVAGITAAQVESLNADVINAGAVRGINVNAASHTTKGSYLTASVSGGAMVVNVKNTDDFSAGGGTAYVFDPAADRDQFTYTGKTATTLTGCSGVAGHPIGCTIVPMVANIAIDSLTNEMRYFGNRGDGTVDELISLGVSTPSFGSDTIVARFGNQNTTRYPVYGISGDQHAIVGRTYATASFAGVAGFAESGGIGVYGWSNSTGLAGYFFNNTSGPALLASSNSGKSLEVYGNSTYGPISLLPLTGRPSNRTAGQLAMINTSGGTTDARTGAPYLMYTNGDGQWRYVVDSSQFNG